MGDPRLLPPTPMADEPTDDDQPRRDPAEPEQPGRWSAGQYKQRLLRYLYILLRLVFFAIGLVVVYWLGSALGALLVPLVASILLAYLLDPFVRRLQERGLGRRPAILVCLGAGILIIGLVGGFLLPPLIEQIGTLIDELPTLIERVEREWIPWLEERLGTEITTPLDGADQPADGGMRPGTGMIELTRRIGAWTLGAASTTTQALLGFFIFLLIPLFTYYFLRKIGAIKVWLANALPVQRREYTLELVTRMNRAVGNWFRGQLKVALVIGILYSIGLPLAFALVGLDPMLGVAIGIFSGLTNIIPYLGFIVAATLTSLVVLLDWPGLTGVLVVASVFVVNNFLEAYVISPKIVGESVGLHPIAVIILALVGGELAGIAGVLLIIPIAGALQVIWPDLMALYRETAFYRGDERRAEDASE